LKIFWTFFLLIEKHHIVENEKNDLTAGSLKNDPIFGPKNSGIQIPFLLRHQNLP
jgi:hypothetical protein